MKHPTLKGPDLVEVVAEEHFPDQLEAGRGSSCSSNPAHFQSFQPAAIAVLELAVISQPQSVPVHFSTQAQLASVVVLEGELEFARVAVEQEQVAVAHNVFVPAPSAFGALSLLALEVVDAASQVVNLLPSFLPLSGQILLHPLALAWTVVPIAVDSFRRWQSEFKNSSHQGPYI